MLKKIITVNALVIASFIVLRLFFTAWFYHPDIKSQYFHGSLTDRGVVNVYTYLDEHKNQLPYRDTFNYPPLTYFLFGGWYQISKIILGSSLSVWLWDWGADQLNYQNLQSFLLVLKLPYIITEVVLLFLAAKYLSNQVLFKKFWWLWVFNPLVWYTGLMIGQFDILPATLTLAALVFSPQILISGLLLGIGAGLKTYPLLLLPFFLLGVSQIKNKLYFLTAFLIGWIVPGSLLIGPQGFFASIFNSPLSGTILNPLFLGFYLLIFLVVISFKKTQNRLVWSCLAVTIGVLLFTNYHPQWLMWSLPLLVLSLTRHWKLLWFPIVVFGLGFLTNLMFIPDQYMFIGLLSPFNPQLSHMPPLSNLLLKLPGQFPQLLANFSQGVFTVTGLYLLIVLYFKTDHETSNT